MENNEVIDLWKAQNEKIEQSLLLNKRLLLEAINQKARNALLPLKNLKKTGIVITVLYLMLLGYLLFYAISNYTPAADYFIVSMSAIALINVKGLADYIKHLIWAHDINYSGSITEIQHILLKLQFSIVKHTRVMFLQLPFWTTFYLSNTWFPGKVGVPYIVFQVAFTGIFTYAALWLYKNQTIANLDKKWYQKLIAGSGGKAVRNALNFYKEIESFKLEK